MPQQPMHTQNRLKYLSRRLDRMITDTWARRRAVVDSTIHVARARTCDQCDPHSHRARTAHKPVHACSNARLCMSEHLVRAVYPHQLQPEAGTGHAGGLVMTVSRVTLHGAHGAATLGKISTLETEQGAASSQ